MSKHKVKLFRRPTGVWCVWVALDGLYWVWDFDTIDTASKFADTLRESEILSDGKGGLIGKTKSRKKR